MKPDFFSGVRVRPLKSGAVIFRFPSHPPVPSLFLYFSPSLSLSSSFFSLPLHLHLQLSPQSSNSRIVTHPQYDARIGANTLKNFFPDAVLEAHGRTRTRIGTMGRRTRFEECRSDGRAGRVQGERASTPRHPCSPGTPWCTLGSVSASYHRMSSCRVPSCHPRFE
jgi:hypothetical protein